jgi:hypothetical protein
MRDLKVEEYQSDFARQYGLLWKAKGFAEGFAQGYVEGLAEGVLSNLSVRKLLLTDEQTARIKSCRDPAQLRLWHRRTMTIATAAEIFAPTR